MESVGQFPVLAVEVFPRAEGPGQRHPQFIKKGEVGLDAGSGPGAMKLFGGGRDFGEHRGAAGLENAGRAGQLQDAGSQPGKVAEAFHPTVVAQDSAEQFHVVGPEGREVALAQEPEGSLGAAQVEVPEELPLVGFPAAHQLGAEHFDCPVLAVAPLLAMAYPEVGQGGIAGEEARKPFRERTGHQNFPLEGTKLLDDPRHRDRDAIPEHPEGSELHLPLAGPQIHPKPQLQLIPGWAGRAGRP